MGRVGVFARVMAAAIDGLGALVLLIVSGIIAAIADKTALAGLVFLILWLFYSGMEVVFAGTPGKLLLGLRIARQNGLKAEPSRLLLRWSTKYYVLVPSIFDYFFPGTAVAMAGSCVNGLILCGLLGAFNGDRLTWHDQWAGTAVWKRRPAPPSLSVAITS
jgi:uncharacterized RDD family membrane protein YckC